MANSADPDQLATDLELHCLQRQGIFPFFFFFLIWVLRPFQEYLTYISIEPIVHQIGQKPENVGEKTT